VVQLPHIERDQFLRSLESVAAEAGQSDSPFGLLLIDLSNLGSINRRAGFDVGDRLLASAYQSLCSVSKLPDGVFRIAGHGFAFILPNLPNPGFIALAVNRVQQVLQEGLSVDEEGVTATINVGLALGRPGLHDHLTVLARAEASLVQVKLGAGLGIEELLAEEDEQSADMKFEQRFAEALNENAFELYYQPKVHARSGAVVGAEALLRWQLDGYGQVPPERIVRMAEETGKIYDLSKWVLNRALRQRKQWSGSFDLPVSVNIPASMVNHPDLANMIHDALSIWGVAAEMLTVEITEDAVIEDKEAGFHILQELRQQGITISIDDFGTGYSSLSYFQHIPATELKIDKSFVQHLLDREVEQELVRIVIYLGHLFGLRVDAEGVEDRATQERLRELGCDVIQGYLYSRPLPTAEFLAWVAEHQAEDCFSPLD